MSLHARCFLCGSRITSDNLRSEESLSGGSVVLRRYECDFCSAEHTVRGYATPHAASTNVRPGVLAISRHQAVADLVDLAQAICNTESTFTERIPLQFFADLSQVGEAWAEGELTGGPVAAEFQRIRQLNAR